MSDIAPIPGLGIDRVDAYRPERPAPRAAAREEARTERPSDRVDISDRARYLSKLSSLPDVRQELVDRVRKEIAEGTYETPEKLDQALASLIEDLEGHA